MSLSSAAVHAAAPERATQELLLEFLKRYFTGVPHLSNLGDQVFPKCDLLFGDAVAPVPGALPQLDGVTVQAPLAREGWTGGDASPWEALLAAPASGVKYGRTADGRVEETVHGKLRRDFRGTDIRWRHVGTVVVEEVLNGGIWVQQRAFSGTDSLAWVRDGDTSTGPGDAGDYVELMLPSRLEARRIPVVNPVWDGNTLRIFGCLRVQWFARVLAAGESDNAPDFRCRAVTDALAQLFARPDATLLLAQKGLAKWQVGTVLNVSIPGVIVRTVMTECAVEWMLPL